MEKFAERIDALSVENMEDVERSFSELQGQASFIPGFAQLLTGCAAVCISFLDHAFDDDPSISTSITLQGHSGEDVEAEIILERTCKLPSFFEENKPVNRELMEKLKRDLKRYFDMFETSGGKYEYEVEGEMGYPSSVEKETAFALSKMLHYAAASGPVPYGEYAWNLCMGGFLYGLRLKYVRVDKKQAPEKSPEETIPTYHVYVSSSRPSESEKSDCAKSVSSGVGDVFKGFAMTLFLFVALVVFTLPHPPVHSSDVIDRNSIMRELRFRASGETEPRPDGTKRRDDLGDMSVSQLIDKLENANKNAEEMRGILRLENIEEFETPKELETRMTKAREAFSSANEEEFESLLRSATIEELKNYKKTADKLAESAEKEDVSK